jgi:hypothetical protein
LPQTGTPPVVVVAVVVSLVDGAVVDDSVVDPVALSEVPLPDSPRPVASKMQPARARLRQGARRPRRAREFMGNLLGEKNKS